MKLIRILMNISHFFLENAIIKVGFEMSFLGNEELGKIATGKLAPISHYAHYAYLSL